jgi:hypothetical protein
LINITFCGRLLIIQERLAADHEEYLRKHPEVRQISADYLKAAMYRRPDDLYQFTRDYFKMFQSAQTTNKGSE